MSSDKTWGIKLGAREGRAALASDNPDLGEAHEELDVPLRRRAAHDRLQRQVLHRAPRRDGGRRGQARAQRRARPGPGAAGRRQRSYLGVVMPMRHLTDVAPASRVRIRERSRARSSSSSATSQVLVEPHPRFNVLCGRQRSGQDQRPRGHLLPRRRCASFRAGTDGGAGALRGAAGARAGARWRSWGSSARSRSSCGPRPQDGARGRQGRARARGYFGGFNVVLFAPEDLRLPRAAAGGAAALPRPRGLEREPAYLARRRPTRGCCVAQCGAARRGGGRRRHCSRSTTSSWRRRRWRSSRGGGACRRAGAAGAAAFERVHGDRPVDARYRSDADVDAAIGEADVGRAARAGCARSGGAIWRAAFTSCGPHTDDLELRARRHDGARVRVAGAAARRRAGAEDRRDRNLSDELGDAPVLLLDDVSSELDPTRNAHVRDVASCSARP